MATGIGNAVFLSNVDDFVSPSQACVNPLYGGNETTPPPPPSSAAPNNAAVGGIVQKRQKRRGQKEEIVTATLADCLACSGCVTTAETVLLQERHNISKLVAAIDDQKRPILLTFSPAARADWERTHDGTLDISAWIKYLGVLVVVDGNVPLQWSRETAVDEFVRAWKTKCQGNSKGSAAATSVPVTETWERDEVPSKAMGEQKTEYYVATGATTAAPTVESHLPQLRTQQQFPILSSSCPAIVCYMETSHHSGVSHLSVAASPMAVAASAVDASVPNLFHVAVQPCHDKKLEAGRLDFSTNVDLVLTTSEWNDFVQERIPTTPSTQPPPKKHIVRTPAQLREVLQTAATASARQSLKQQEGILCVAAPEETPTPSNNNHPALFLAGSGSYADTIFRQATQRIFGVDCIQPHWIQPGASRRRTRSREHYEANLYRRTRDGSLTSQPPAAEEESTVIWRFAIVYGMQTVQRLLSNNNDWKERYDYMEVMACAGSCLNGAGQQRKSSDATTEITSPSSTAPGVETPAITRERLAATRSHFRPLSLNHDTDDTATVDPYYYTTYHIVPPLQHALGAAAGVAVQDTQW